MERINMGNVRLYHNIVIRLYTLILFLPFVLAIVSFVDFHGENSFHTAGYRKLDDTLIESYTGSRLEMEGKLPQDIADGNVIYVYSRQEKIEIYVNDSEPGMEWKSEGSDSRNAMLDGWHRVYLNRDLSGADFRIILTSLNGSKAKHIHSVYMGDESAVLQHLILLYCYPVFSGILLFLLGLFMLGYSLTAWKMGSRVYHFLGAFMMFAGVYLLYSAQIRQVYLGWAEYADNMAFICLLMAQIPLAAVVDEGTGRIYHALLTVLACMEMAFSILTTALMMVHIWNPGQLFLILRFLYIWQLLFYLILLMKKNGSEESSMKRGKMKIAFFLLLGGGITEAGMWYGLQIDLAGAGVTSGVLAFSLIGIAEFWEWMRALLARERQALVRNEEKNIFLAEMSHSIRTPANTVLGMDLMILRRSKDPVVNSYAADIWNAGQSLLAVIDNILDFSKIGSGKMVIHPCAYQLTSLISDCYQMVIFKVQGKKLEFHIANDPQIPDYLYGDETRIRQIITNLLTNAVKYTFTGDITLELDYEKENSECILLKISVKDTGIGIREENIPDLFQSYKRLHEYDNPAIEGSGLGLSIVKHTVELMDGKVEVASVYGKGSIFTVTIPQVVKGWEQIGNLGLLLENGIRKPAGKVEWFRAPQARVLIVDDVKMNLKVMSALLDASGMEIDCALSGQECLKLAAQKKYDMIFMDHIMPGMDGEETFRRMCGMNPNRNRNTPVIMLTANAIMGAKEEYMGAGFGGYISKPVREEELRDICMQYLPDRKIQKTEDEAEDSEQQIDLQVQNMQDIKLEKLSELLDTKTGIAYCVDDAQLYLEILSDYVLPERKQQIIEAYETQKWDNYRVGVHSLKSTSKTIGAMQLSEMALSLETAAKQNNLEYIKEHHAMMMQVYENLKENISRILA